MTERIVLILVVASEPLNMTKPFGVRCPVAVSPLIEHVNDASKVLDFFKFLKSGSENVAAQRLAKSWTDARPEKNLHVLPVSLRQFRAAGLVILKFKSARCLWLPR